MSDWILTIPKTVKWEVYKIEMGAVRDWNQVMRYRLPYSPAATKGDRCFVVWNGRVRGWMEVTGTYYLKDSWKCSVTGNTWKPGWYVERSGPFHKVDGPEMRGFRGFRRFWK